MKKCIICLFALVLMMTAGTALTAPSATLTGPLMAINSIEGYVVVNEVVIYVDSLPDPTIVDALTQGQWVSVDVMEDSGQLWATDLTIGKDSSTGSVQDSN